MASDNALVTAQKQRRRGIGNPDKIIPYRYKPGQSGNPHRSCFGADPRWAKLLFYSDGQVGQVVRETRLLRVQEVRSTIANHAWLVH